MRSLRLKPELDERVRQAAEREGSSISEFLRRAAAERADQTLGENLAERLSYAIGIVNTDLAQARDTGGAFAEVVGRKHRNRRR